MKDINITYKEVTEDGVYPKTVIIRNRHDGLIWQVYHVQKEIEALRLIRNATMNAFQGISLEDYQPEIEETCPDWRDTDGGKEIINNL